MATIQEKVGERAERGLAMLQAGYGGVDRSQMLTVIQDGITDLLHLASIAIEANGEEDVSPTDLLQGA